MALEVWKTSTTFWRILILAQEMSSEELQAVGIRASLEAATSPVPFSLITNIFGQGKHARTTYNGLLVPCLTAPQNAFNPIQQI